LPNFNDNQVAAARENNECDCQAWLDNATVLRLDTIDAAFLFPPQGLGLDKNFPDSAETVIEDMTGEGAIEKEKEVVTAAEAKSDHENV